MAGTHCTPPRSFRLTCHHCKCTYLASSGARKKCPDCCKCEECGKQLPNGSHRFCSRECSGKHNYRESEAVKQAIKKGQNDPKRIDAVRQMAKSQKGKPRPNQRGENNPNWKGGYRNHRQTEMGRVEYKIWRATIFKRDKHKCILCGNNLDLQANHIKTWKKYPELRYDIYNGVTLCRECHKSIYGIEHQFVDRFTDYVSKKDKVELTDDEKHRFTNFIARCSECGKETQRPRHHRTRKFFFCDRKCQRLFVKKPQWSEFISQSRVKNRYITKCSECGNEVIRKNCERHYAYVFCNRECQNLFAKKPEYRQFLKERKKKR